MARDSISSVPIPRRFYRHFKGHLYEVLDLTLSSATPPPPGVNLICWYEAIDTESGEFYEVISPQCSSHTWLRNSDGELLDKPYVVYTPREPVPETAAKESVESETLTWARPLNSWMRPAAPPGLGRGWLFRLGLVSGIERFVELPRNTFGLGESFELPQD